MLDETGEVVARHAGERTIPDFEKTVARAVFHIDAKKRAASGDKSGSIDLVIAKLELGTVTGEEATKQMEGLGELTKEQRVHLDAALLNAEVAAIAKAAGNDRASSGKKFVEMKNAGRIPTGAMEYLQFWDAILIDAEARKDIPLFEEGLAKLREKLGSNPNKKSFFTNKEAILKKLKEKK